MVKLFKHSKNFKLFNRLSQFWKVARTQDNMPGGEFHEALKLHYLDRPQPNPQ